MLFDTHAHYDDEQFSQNVYELLDSMQENNVGYIINSCSDICEIPRILELCEKYPFMFASVGVHPHNAEHMTEADLDKLRQFSKHEKVVAIGEIGLDYHYDLSERDVQQLWFGRQVDLARELGLPVIIHDREAHSDTLRILREHKVSEAGGVFHCYSGSAEMAREVLDLGMYIAFGGSLTFKKSVKPVQTAQIVPEERMLLETDCPYLAPEPVRGRINSSLYMHFTAEKLAEIRGESVEKIEKITLENAKKLFRIK